MPSSIPAQDTTSAHTASETPLWTPTADQMENSHLWRFKKRVEQKYGLSFGDYMDIWQWSVDRKAYFWSECWDYFGIIGEKGDVALSDADKMPGAQFFPQARLNYAENMLRRRDDALAIVFRGEDKVELTLSWSDLYAQVASMAKYLRDLGVTKGDRVAGFMPNMPHTIVATLAAASIGAIWSSASPDFGVQGVLDRFGQIEPKVLIAVNGYYYNGKTVNCLEKIADVQKQLPSLQKTILVRYADGLDDISALSGATEWYSDIVANVPDGDIPFTRVEFNHPLFIMFSSGTTGIPKCIVHGTGGTLIQHIKEHQLQSNVQKGDRVFYFTTCGWMMWNWLITGLASEATLLLYDGSPFYPAPNVLFDYADAYDMTLFGTAAKYIDALRNNNVKPMETHRLTALRTMTSTGSPLVHESFDYVYGNIKRNLHLASISGGTDIISCFVIGNPLSPVYRGEIQGAGLGYDMDCFDENGNSMDAGGGKGELVCKSPFPSMPVMFWNDPDGKRYHAAYFDRFTHIWCHGDWVEKTTHGGWVIHGRSDATLNPGGVRIGTAEIYRQVEQIDVVNESLVIGQNWDNDVRVVLFVVLKSGVKLDDDLKNTIKKRIREGASPRHVPAKIIHVTDIPRTKSGKITELAVRDIVHGNPVKNVEALANPDALELYKNLPELQN